ncbi:MAG: DUF424 domain-containing protein [Nitrosopumilus sp.]|nr:DUF424 domain-containing protein [Nitrosopumilus sp.]CAI9832116.1 conserved hypothetical protein [Nitrosopumilaceae archaeon]MDA7941386.1 DUF424 domain-containing protein [Nitrosopumilus sp.]MDA7942794.1 DUF424 domain-containing protein [Nitrosopumilus sp.]MDA7945080.1 DUF424 domain-containing protein [Nitrosopumilus sp.]
MFSARSSVYDGNRMLNICDLRMLGSEVAEGELVMRISESCYGGQRVGEEEAAGLLEGSSIINMAGRECVELSIRLGIGSRDAVRHIDGVPFLLVFKA